MKPKKWVAVEEKNDWGSITTYLNKKAMTMTTHPEGTIDVMFPSGDIQKCMLGWHNHQETVSDHGQSYTVNSPVPMIGFRHHGLDISMRLSTKGLKINGSSF